MSYKERSEEYRGFFEGYLKDIYANAESEPQKMLYDAMQYSLLAGGKRLRPVLVFDFCRMCGGCWQAAAPFAAAIEMIHTYSLIHDDLPCMDNDDFRRGKPTNHKVYGEAMAVLAGDGLLTDAFKIAGNISLNDPTRILRGIKVLSECAGSFGMVGGQVLDIMSEQRACTEQEVLDIQSRKTGALIKAACVLGAIAGGGSEEQITAASEFAQYLGLAFQIRDDMLDVIGNAQELGKSVGTDEGKNTFVSLYGLDRCESLLREYTALAIKELDAFEDREAMTELANAMVQRRI